MCSFFEVTSRFLNIICRNLGRVTQKVGLVRMKFLPVSLNLCGTNLDTPARRNENIRRQNYQVSAFACFLSFVDSHLKIISLDTAGVHNLLPSKCCIVILAVDHRYTEGRNDNRPGA